MNLDQVIPKEILDMLNDDLFELKIVFRSTDCEGRWPQVRVTVNNVKVFDQPIVGLAECCYSTRCDDPQVQVDIEYYGKQDGDTTVDSENRILQDQAVFLEQIVVNGVDLIKTRIIYSGLGQYTKNLTPEKIQHYRSIGAAVEPTCSTSMYDNGIWSIKLKMPVMSFLIAKLNGETPITQAFEVEKLIIDTYTTAIKVQETSS